MKIQLTFDTDFNDMEGDLIKLITEAVGEYINNNTKAPAVTPAPAPVGEQKVLTTPPAPAPVGEQKVSTTPPAPAVAPAPAVDPVPDVDGNGVVFDPAVHSSARKLNQDGSWKLRRGAAKADSAPQPAAPSTQVSFPALMNAVRDSGLTTDQIDALAVKHGLDNIYEAAINPEVIEAIMGELNV